MEKVQLKIKNETKTILNSGTFEGAAINWVGSKKQKGRPMGMKAIKGILEVYNVPKVLKYQNLYFYLDLEAHDKGIRFNLKEIKNLDDLKKMNLKGWYNYADAHRRKKIGVYNICRSIREILIKEFPNLQPNLIQIMIDIK